MTYLFFSFLFSLTSASSAYAEPCREIRGALDIGSGSAKALAAEVNPCEKKILKSVYNEDLPFPCNEALEKSPDGSLPPTFLETYSPRIATLVKNARAKGAKSFAVKATSCLRKASNGKAVAEALGQAIGEPVRIISQEEEAEVGFLSGLAAHGIAPGSELNVVVWDIGGGSMQMRANTDGEAQEYRGGMAAVGFKNRVIREIQKKNPDLTPSPNPLGDKWPRAAALAEKHAARTVPTYFKRIKNRRRWLGIGGALARSVQEQVDPTAHAFTRAGLEKALKQRSSLNDDQLASPYAVTQVTNLALVLGFMRALGIEKVETAEASLNEGTLAQELALPSRSAVPATEAKPLPAKTVPVIPKPADTKLPTVTPTPSTPAPLK